MHREEECFFFREYANSISYFYRREKNHLQELVQDANIPIRVQPTPTLKQLRLLSHKSMQYTYAHSRKFPFPQDVQVKLCYSLYLLCAIEHSSISLLPECSSNCRDKGVKISLVSTVKARPSPYPPLQESILSFRALNCDVEVRQASVPDFSSVATLNVDVLSVVLILETSMARRGCIL